MEYKKETDTAKPIDEQQKKKINTSNIKGMIFDMDGTVINSNKRDYEAWKRILQEHKVIWIIKNILNF